MPSGWWSRCSGEGRDRGAKQAAPTPRRRLAYERCVEVGTRARDERSVARGAHHGLLFGHRRRHGLPPGQGRLARLRDRPPARDARRARGRRLPDTGPRRGRRGVAPSGRRRRRGGGGGGRRTHQQRRLQPVGRRGVDPRRSRPCPVRDQRLRAARAVPAGAARDARAGGGQDRPALVDGGEAHLPRRRPVPRHQARGRGDLGCAALRGQELRRRRDRHRAGPHHVRLQRRGGARARHRIGGPGAVRGLQPRGRRGLARCLREGPALQARRSARGRRRAHRARAQRQALPRSLHGHPVGAGAADPPRRPARPRLGRGGGRVVPATGKGIEMTVQARHACQRWLPRVMRPAYAIAVVLAAVLTVGAQAATAGGFERGDVLVSVGNPSVIARFAPDGTPKGALAQSDGAGPLCFDRSGEHLVAPGTGLYDSTGTRLASAWASVNPRGDCTIDKAGNVYLAGGPFTGDRLTGRATIRKFDLTGHPLGSYDVAATGYTYGRAVYSLDVAPDQCTIYYGLDGGEEIQRYDVCTN